MLKIFWNMGLCAEVLQKWWMESFLQRWEIHFCKEFCWRMIGERLSILSSYWIFLLNENNQLCRIYSDVGKGLSERIMNTGASDWSTLITWPEYWPLIGQYWSSIAPVFSRLEPSHWTEPPSWDMNTPWNCLNISTSIERENSFGKRK